MTVDEGSEFTPMGPVLYRKFCTLVTRRSGLSYDEKAQPILERRTAPRLRELGLAGYREYVDRLQNEPSELIRLYETLTTKETYFFRQEYQLNAFVNELIPLMASTGGPHSRFTIWSAGCSTGEETYTLAMLLSESELFRGWKIRVIGTDLCPSNIEAASRGVYRSGSFRTLDEERVEKYFTEAEGGLCVNSELRRLVHFSVGNLMNPVEVRSVGRVDMIFCRNVLIYFDENSRRAATTLFYERLLPGGYLLLGHSESLLNAGTDFEPVHLKGDLVYQRPPLGSQSRMKTS